MIITRVDGTKIDNDRLRGGGDPYAEPERTDPRAIAEQIPRDYYGRTRKGSTNTTREIDWCSDTEDWS